MQSKTENHVERRTFLANDLRKSGITDGNVLQAIEKIPRHLFFGDHISLIDPSVIYTNNAFPIGSGQTISRPYVTAFQAQSLYIKPMDKILEVGTGSGYLAAVLSEMDGVVYTTERIKSIYDTANNLLKQIGYENVTCYWHDCSEGLKREAPFDKIIVTAFFRELPKNLLKQLKTGGILVFPFGDQYNCRLLRVIKTGVDEYESEVLTSEFMFSPVLQGVILS